LIVLNGLAVKKKWIILFSLFFTGSAGKAFTQVVYVNTISGIFQLTGGVGSTERVLISNGCGIDNTLLSIAVYKDTIYYNTWGGDLKRFKIGSPGTCETLISGGPFYNSMTVDKNGIIYMANEDLIRFDPYKKQLTHLGVMPFNSGGDMIFFKDKLLLAGWDPYDWSTGIYELNINDLSKSCLYMNTPDFIGLLAYPSACGRNRYFGLSVDNAQGTQVTELDLVNKKIEGSSYSIPEDMLDAASNAEMGLEDGIEITAITRTISDNCSNNNGSISITASSINAPISYTLLNTGMVQKTGTFTNLRGGLYNFRITNSKGCAKDTSIALAENIPPGCNDIFIPNAFTPNNDGINDLFKVSFQSSMDVKLEIFNRWGTEVYSGKGSQIAWDGSFRGTQQPVGVYIYIINYTGQSGTNKTLKGTLTLLR
jgi:gliding motility-associated-like protein